jgi:hypothetical protein
MISANGLVHVEDLKRGPLPTSDESGGQDRSKERSC